MFLIILIYNNFVSDGQLPRERCLAYKRKATETKGKETMSSKASNKSNSENQVMAIDDLIGEALRGHAIRILCLDTETTGLGDDDRITQFSATMVVLASQEDVTALRNGDIAPITCETYDRFCNPGIPISDDAARVTGITNETVRGLPSFRDGILPDAQRLVDSADLIVGHNVGFDIKKLRHDGVDVPSSKPVSDTMFDFRDMCRFRWGIERPEKNLTAATAVFGYAFDAHNSANDVAATLFLFSQLLRVEECCSWSADALVRQHETHSKRVQAYLRRFARPDSLAKAA